jgi:hypothetical protein
VELDSLRLRIEQLERKLRPIANRPVEFGPNLRDRLRSLPPPLDEAGVRAEAEQALLEAIELYSRSDSAQRERIREIFRVNHAFAWAAALPYPPDTAERFRQHLMHFSIVDKGPDWRDALLWMRDLMRSPLATEEVLTEVAALSSDWARDLLLRRHTG